MKQTYLKPFTQKIEGLSIRVICGSNNEPSTPGNPTDGEFVFGGKKV